MERKWRPHPLPHPLPHRRRPLPNVQNPMSKLKKRLLTCVADSIVIIWKNWPTFEAETKETQQILVQEK